MTDQVLELLDRYSASATFFCTGRNAEKHPEWIDRIRAKGHGIGNHGYEHLNGQRHDSSTYLADVERASRSLSSSLFRPPYGRLSRQQALCLHHRFRIVMWDVLSGDFDPEMSGEDCAKKSIRHARAGSILLFHDSKKAEERLLKALPRVLEHFYELGYRFPPIPGSQEPALDKKLLQDPQ